MQRNLDERLARMRAHLHTAMVDLGMSVGQLASKLGLDAVALTGYLNGREAMPVPTLLKLAELTHKPLWWFFDEPPHGITLESAEIALQNISRVRLYLEALETEFQLVVARHRKEPTFTSYDSDTPLPNIPHDPSAQGGPPHKTADIVDFSKYLNRARAILQREFESEEKAEVVSEESIEMVAQGLLSAEMGRPVTDMVERLRKRNGRSMEDSLADF